MLPNIFNEANLILIPKSDKKLQKSKLHTNIPHEYGHEILNKYYHMKSINI